MSNLGSGPVDSSLATIIVFCLSVLLARGQGPIRPSNRQTAQAPNLQSSGTASGNYDALIGKAINLIQSGDFTQAAVTARQSIAMAADRYEGYLYLGISRFRQDAVADAESALQKALSLAPADRKAKVQDALDLVVKTRRFRELMATAEEADRDGARAKAARTYAEAWWLFPDRVDIAAKALKGLTGTQNDFEAARIWNTLTPAQKKDNAAALQGISIDTREVQNENDRRKPSLQQAISASQYDRAIEIAKPMAEADSTAYAPVLAALMFLSNDHTALRASSALKPEQLIRMDFFTEAQMNSLVHGELFRRYIEDVTGGNPAQIIDSLQLLFDKRILAELLEGLQKEPLLHTSWDREFNGQILKDHVEPTGEPACQFGVRHITIGESLFLPSKEDAVLDFASSGRISIELIEAPRALAFFCKGCVSGSEIRGPELQFKHQLFPDAYDVPFPPSTSKASITALKERFEQVIKACQSSSSVPRK
jgi:tetratricopeptide (TPR) repeat protein